MSSFNFNGFSGWRQAYTSTLNFSSNPQMFFLFISLCLSLVSPFSLLLAVTVCTSLEHEASRNTERKKTVPVCRQTRTQRLLLGRWKLFSFLGWFRRMFFRLHRKATSCNIAAATFSRKIFYHHHCIMMKKGGKNNFLCVRQGKFYCFPSCIRLAVVKAFFMNSKFGCCLMS